MGMEVRIIGADTDMDMAGGIAGGGDIIITVDIVTAGITIEGHDIFGADRFSSPGTRTGIMLPRRLSSRKSPGYMFNLNRPRIITGITVRTRRATILIFDNAPVDG
jgi:hypothetical protein